MLIDDYLVQLMVMEHMKDVQREAEPRRLARVARNPRKVQGWRLRVALVLSSLLALFMRPQS